MMKKKIVLLTTVALFAGMLSACGKDTAYLSGIKASKYVQLGEYKGIEVKADEPDITDEDVNDYLDYICAIYGETVEVTDRAVQEGDTVNIDYAGYRDGVAFDGGTAQGQDLTIGSGRFIPGFEDGLIGANIGDSVSLDLTFPENYNEEMAGAEVTFEVTINSISVLEPAELTDEFASELTAGEYDTVEALRAYSRDMLYENALSTYNTTVANSLMQTIMGSCTFEELPEKMTDRYYDILVKTYTSEAAQYGVDLNTYMQNYYGMSAEAYPAWIRQNAVTMAQQYIMFQAVADAENLNLTDEEVAQKIEENATAYGYDSTDEFLEELEEENFREYLMAERVMDFLIDNAVVVSE